MEWQPPPRPDWVASINAGAVPLIAEEGSLPLTRDALLAEACARLGRAPADWSAFGAEGFPLDQMLEPFECAVRALEHEAELHLLGRFMTRRFLLRLLEVRIQLMDLVRGDPSLRDEAIVEPLFVAGAPRTGTTILHALLAADPAHRVPEGWELLRPVPPPDPDPEVFARDPRIALADRELVGPQTVVSGLLSIHPYGGRRPKECLSAMSFAFRTEELTARYHVPSYQAWLERCDMRPAYAMHRLVLQVLQRRFRGVRWVLKSPVHLHALPTLLETYPDARVAITHRDPLVFLASLGSLIANLRYAHSDAVDVPAIGRAHAERFASSLARLVEWTDAGTLPAARLHHSRYADFVDDADRVLAGLYDLLGRSRSSALVARTSEILAAGRSESGHDYSFEMLGLDRDLWRGRFRDYQARFDVPDEP